MSGGETPSARFSRRGFMAGSTGLLAVAGIGDQARAATASSTRPPAAATPTLIEPFFGAHQAGILTPVQSHTYVAAFDVVATKGREVAELMRRWSDSAALMTRGQSAEAMIYKAQGTDYDTDAPTADSEDVAGLPASRLTLTFGFGPGLFVKDGADRYGLAKRRPEALMDLPIFPGDQLTPTRTGGDLSVQACAEDPQVAFHAVRQLARLAYGAAEIRWVQSGFVSGAKADATPRNLMGFKDGTNNPQTSDAKAMDEVVWVGTEGPDWMRGGSYVVFRRSRIALEHWDRMTVAFQEQTIGRHKASGAPLGMSKEFDQVDLSAVDADGDPLIPENSHVRLAAAEANGGARILRRAYSYNDGANLTAERWPPWKQGMEWDAGLLFECYQRDPRTGFIKIFERMAKFDMMNQFVTVTGSALFACPGGVAEGEYIGQRLFEGV